MTKQAKKIKITIFEESYGLVTDESEAHILQAASLVDTQMKEIAKHLGTLDLKKLAVLVALQTMSKLLHAERKIEVENKIQERINKELDKALEL